MMKTNTRETNKALENEIDKLKKKLDEAERLNDTMAENYGEAERKQMNYRELLKYHTLIMIIMNLLGNYTKSNDLGQAIQTNINLYYKGLTEDFLTIPTHDDDNDDRDEPLDGEEIFGED